MYASKIRKKGEIERLTKAQPAPRGQSSIPEVISQEFELI
jgi:hypothetical protein